MASDPHNQVARLAEAISDGRAVDWAAAESGADPVGRRLIRELRVVSEIARLHRTHPEPLELTADLPEQRVWAHLTLRGVLGRGAYGVVYRAWDPQLEREVALKLISESEQRDHAAVVVEEGRLLARVRHPGVVTIYGAARANGFAGMWMELVEGRTLEELLQQQGRFSAREAALIGIEVCEALAAVHSAGLLHRDVKAQNVMRDHNGRILLMDFGTGRARVLSGDTPVADLAGTPLYMAPELLRGERASIQSDVYSVGVLLYRLVTGSFPVVARSLAEVREVHALGRSRRLRDERSDLPATFVQIVERALSPEVSRRYESAGALEMALTGLLATTIDASSVPVSQPAKPFKPGPVLAVAAALIAGLVLGIGLARRPPDAARAPLARFLVPPPTEEAFESFSLSPDGRYVAFVNAGRLWVKSLASVEATPLSDTGGSHDPFWSPDGRYIAYFKQNSLWVVGISGGESRVLCPARNAMGGSWGSDGTILFAADLGEAIYRVPAVGGERTPLRVQGTHGYDLRWPSFLPGRQAFVYSARSQPLGARGVYIGWLEGGADRLLIEGAANAQVADGWILFVQRGKLFAQRFDMRGLRVEPQRTLVAERVRSNLYNRADYANFSAAASGSRLLAYLGTRQVDRELRLYDRSGASALLLGPGEYRDLAVSPSGRQVAFEQLDEVTGARDIWTLDLARRQPVRLTSHADDDIAPVWSADERTVYFASDRSGSFGLYRRAADATGEDEQVLDDSSRIVPFSVSPDNRLLLFTRPHQKRDLDLWLLQLVQPYTQTPYRTSAWRESEPCFSPDGAWLAYSTTDTGDRHVYIERVDRPGPRWQVSVKNGREPSWRADGKEIYYHGPNRMLMAVSVDISRTPPTIGAPRPLFELPFRGWDVRYHYSPVSDGQSFVLNVPIPGSSPMPLTFVQNWTDQN